MSAGAQGSEAANWIYRDKEPPPAYGGENPQSTFRGYLRDLELWQAGTDIPEDKQGLKLVQVLTGTAKAAVDGLPVSEIKGAGGYKAVLKKLKEAFEPYVETALPRALEGALFGPPRGSKETLAEYIIRFEKAQAILKDEGVTLPTKAVGYLLHRQANLDAELDGRLTTWLAGDYSKDNVLANLRRLERVHQETGKKVFLGLGEEEPQEEEWPEEAPLDAFYQEDSSEDENYVYLGDGDDGEVFEEEALVEALASYQEARQRIKEQRLGRKFFKPGFGKQSAGKGRGQHKGKGKGQYKDAGGFGSGRGRWGKGPGGGSKIHIEELKLRTRCRACGQVGHWSRECPSNRGPSSNASSSAASAPSYGKPGSATSFYWGGSNTAGSASFLTLKEILGAQKQKKVSVASFCGVVTSEGQALVDTAAQDGLIGKPSLLRLCSVLREQGLGCKWLDKSSAARGIGGQATTVGVVEIPMGLAGVSGILECTVISEDVPLLLPISLLRSLGAEINLPKNSLSLTYLGATCSMTTLLSGHAAVSVVDFGPDGWTLPSQCVGTRTAKDFSVNSSLAQQRSGFVSMCKGEASTTVSSFVTHAGGPGAEREPPGGSKTTQGARSHQARPSQLARRWGQAVLLGVLGAATQCSLQLPAEHPSIGGYEQLGVLDYLRASSYQQGGLLQGLHLQGPAAATAEQCEGDPGPGCGDVPPRGPLPQGRRKWSRQLGALCPVPVEVVLGARGSGFGDRAPAAASDGGGASPGGTQGQGEGEGRRAAAKQQAERGPNRGGLPPGDRGPEGEDAAPAGAARAPDGHDRGDRHGGGRLQCPGGVLPEHGPDDATRSSGGGDRVPSAQSRGGGLPHEEQALPDQGHERRVDSGSRQPEDRGGPDERLLPERYETAGPDQQPVAALRPLSADLASPNGKLVLKKASPKAIEAGLKMSLLGDPSCHKLHCVACSS